MTQMRCEAVFSQQGRAKTGRGRRSVLRAGGEGGSKGPHDYGRRGHCEVA